LQPINLFADDAGDGSNGLSARTHRRVPEFAMELARFERPSCDSPAIKSSLKLIELAAHNFTRAAQLVRQLLVCRANDTLGTRELQQPLRQPDVNPRERDLFNNAEEVCNAVAKDGKYESTKRA
jgi:hypothetical protein